MAFPKLRLSWTGSRIEADWHLGLFGVYTRGSHGGRLRGVVISVRGLLAWMAGLAVIAYFTGALALLLWFGRHPYNKITYADLILPTRWSHVQKLRGQALVAEGLDDIKARRWSSGIAKLRVGLIRDPSQIEGRQTLADLFIAMNARKLAVEIYDGGLVTRYPGRDYVEAMIKSAAQSENYAWSLRTCDRALALIANNPALAADRKWLIQQKLAALLGMDRVDEALTLAESEGEAGNSVISEFRVLALLKAGKSAEALAFLNAWADRLGSRADAQVLRLQVRAFREAGDYAGMDRALEQLRTLSPTDPRVYIYGIVQHLLGGRRSDADAAFDAFVLRFGSTPQYLQILASPLAEINDAPMLERLVAYAQQQGFQLDVFHHYLVEALVGKGDWRRAAAVLATSETDPKATPGAASSAWRDIMQAQIHAALDPSEGVQSTLVGLVRGHQFTVTFYKGLIAHMRKAGRATTAREIITFAQGVYPQNTTIEAARKELDEELAIAQAAKPVVTITRPMASVTILATPARVELNEADFLSRLEELTKAGDYEGALKHLRDARFARPLWLEAREAEFSRDEVRIFGRQGDLVALRSAARRYNNGDRLRSAQLMEIARELNTAGSKEAAVLLIRELLAKTPDYTVAQRLLAEWTPKPAAKAP